MNNKPWNESKGISILIGDHIKCRVLFYWVYRCLQFFHVLISRERAAISNNNREFLIFIVSWFILWFKGTFVIPQDYWRMTRFSDHFFWPFSISLLLNIYLINYLFHLLKYRRIWSLLFIDLSWVLVFASFRSLDVRPMKAFTLFVSTILAFISYFWCHKANKRVSIIHDKINVIH